MAGFEENYAGLRALIVRDQFLVKCDDETCCFIKQKGKLDLEDTLTQAQYFIESKEEMERKWVPGHKKEKSRFQDFQKEKNRTLMTRPKERPSESKDTRNFQPKSGFSNPWHLKNQNSDGNKGHMNKGCFVCKSNEHKAYECPKRYGEHSTYKQAMLQCEYEKKNEGDEGEEKVEMSALTLSESNVRDEKKDGDYADFIDSFKVNGRIVKALYDTGATKAALKSDLVRPDQYTDKWVQCKFANGTSARYPIAKVEIDGELFKGMVEVMVIPDLLKKMIVAPKQYARPMKAKKVLTQGSSTNTIIEEELETAQAEDAQKYERPMINEEISDDEEDEVHDVEIATYELRSKTGDTRRRGINPLKWPVLPEWKVTPSEVLEMQMEDPTLEKYWKMARGETGTKESGKEHILFVIKKGMRYRKLKEVLKDGVRLQLMVPEKLRSTVLHMAHESLMSAHQGVKKMQEKISAVFYWPSMLDDVRYHVENCKLNGERHEFDPIELMDRRNIRDPMKILREVWTRGKDEENTRGECLHGLTLQELVPNTYRKGQGRLVKSQLKGGKCYTQKARLSKFDVGDFVKVLFPLKTSKMQRKWLGPFEVIGKIGLLDYRVKLDDGRIKTYHENMLKRDVNKHEEDAAVVENPELAVVTTVVVDDDRVGKEVKRNNRNNGQLKGRYRHYFVRFEEVDEKRIECWCNDGLDHALVQPRFIQDDILWKKILL